MNKETRHNHILSELSKRGEISALTIAKLLNVSLATIRRDLNELDIRGSLKRTHGGAKLKNGLEEIPFNRKINKNLVEKKNISILAASIIEDGKIIGCTGGTTVTHILSMFKNRKITIVTNAVNIAYMLAPFEKTEIILSGGVIRPKSYEIIGTDTIKTISRFIFDIALIGVNGISSKYGLTTYNIEEAEIASLIIERSKKVWVVADYSKFGVTTPAIIAPLSKVDVIITDDKLDDKWIQISKEQGINLHIAKHGNNF